LFVYASLNFTQRAFTHCSHKVTALLIRSFLYYVHENNVTTANVIGRMRQIGLRASSQCGRQLNDRRCCGNTAIKFMYMVHHTDQY